MCALVKISEEPHSRLCERENCTVFHTFKMVISVYQILEKPNFLTAAEETS